MPHSGSSPEVLQTFLDKLVRFSFEHAVWFVMACAWSLLSTTLYGLLLGLQLKCRLWLRLDKYMTLIPKE